MDIIYDMIDNLLNYKMKQIETFFYPRVHLKFMLHCFETVQKKQNIMQQKNGYPLTVDR